MIVMLALGASIASSHTQQEYAHHIGSVVMPFDLATTTHIFRMTDTGGVQRVIAKKPDATDQITLIQRHAPQT